jgi:hypothetical protein
MPEKEPLTGSTEITNTVYVYSKANLFNEGVEDFLIDHVKFNSMVPEANTIYILLD